MAVTFPTVSVRPAAGAATSAQRIAGLAGLAFAILVGLVNILIGASAPPVADASASEISAWVTENRSVLLTATSVVPIGVVLLFTFVSGAYTRLSRSSQEARFWTLLGGIGVILVEVMFLARVLFEVALIANVERLAGEPALVEILWQLQNAAMVFTGIGIAIALTGLSRAGKLDGLIPTWQQGLGFAAALAFIMASVATVFSLEGSAIGIIGLPAFVTWLVWLGITSWRLLKDASIAD